MSTRNGKIARLPESIRHELSLRMEGGESGLNLCNWLNAQPEVHASMAQYFDRRPIFEQNLSEWRQGGHQEWLLTQKSLGLLQLRREQDTEIKQAAASDPVSEVIARRLTLQMVEMADALMEAETDLKKKWDRACALNTQLAKLRHYDQ